MWPSLSRHIGRFPIRHVYLRQLYFSGVQSWPLGLVAGAVVGAVLVALVQKNFGQSSATAMHVLSVSAIREIAPILVALLFTTRSVAAMATEMAAMRVTGEIDTLAMWGIPVGEYLVVPRVIAAALSCALLAVYFLFATLVAGALMVEQSNLVAELGQLASEIPAQLVLLGIFKCALMGGVVSAIACHVGREARADMTEIPRLASRAVLYGVMAIFAIDALIMVPMIYFS